MGLGLGTRQMWNVWIFQYFTASQQLRGVHLDGPFLRDKLNSENGLGRSPYHSLVSHNHLTSSLPNRFPTDRRILPTCTSLRMHSLSIVGYMSPMCAITEIDYDGITTNDSKPWPALSAFAPALHPLIGANLKVIGVNTDSTSSGALARVHTGVWLCTYDMYFSVVQMLHLSDCGLVGEIPPEIFENLPNVVYFGCEENPGLTGPVPYSIVKVRPRVYFPNHYHKCTLPCVCRTSINFNLRPPPDTH